MLYILHRFHCEYLIEDCFPKKVNGGNRKWRWERNKKQECRNYRGDEWEYEGGWRKEMEKARGKEGKDKGKKGRVGGMKSVRKDEPSDIFYRFTSPNIY